MSKKTAGKSKSRIQKPKSRIANPKSRQYVYFFGSGKADGNRTMKDLLGGKGSGLAEMTNAGLPVPPGFTISTEVCSWYYANKRSYPDDLAAQVDAGLASIERELGSRFGDPASPLLVSVRSGAPVSMPGMMDTVLNLGLNDQTVKGLAEASGDARFAYDSYRRFIQMYADVVLGADHYLFEEALEDLKHARGCRFDTDLDADALAELVATYAGLVAKATGKPFPQDPKEQLWGAIGAVFGSWETPRAVTYRRLHNIAGDAFGCDQGFQPSGERRWIGAKDHAAIVVEEAPAAVPGKARISGGANESVHRSRRAADIQHGVQHAGHRSRGARAHRDQERLPSVSEAPAGRCFEEGYSFRQSVVERLHRTGMSVDDRGT
jgi:hypothetical protein